MTATTDTLTDFLLGRIAEDEAAARAALGRYSWPEVAGFVIDDYYDNDLGAAHSHIARHDPARVLAECEAKRRIVALHKAWPVLVEQAPTLDFVDNADPTRVALRASQAFRWLTQQEYRSRFGDEPPTAPILAALAAVYADHPDYRAEWG